MPLSPSTSTSSLNSIRPNASYKKRVPSSSTAEHEVSISNAVRTPIAEPLSRTESPEGCFERKLDEQGRRMLSAIGDPENLSEKNKKALAHYKALKKYDKADEVFFPSDAETGFFRAEVDCLLKGFGIRLINNFDTKTTLQDVIAENIISTKQVNDPKNFKGKSTATNEINAYHLNKIKEYLSGRIKAAATMLRVDKRNRLTPEKFIEKLNQASVEARFFQLESLLNEKDATKKPNAEVREEAIYEIILLGTGAINSSNEFSRWFNEKNENKEKFQKALQVCDYSSSPVKKKANDKTSATNEKIFTLEIELGKLQKELSDANKAIQQKEETIEGHNASSLVSAEKEKELIGQTSQLSDKISFLKSDKKRIQDELQDVRAELAIANNNSDVKQTVLEKTLKTEKTAHLQATAKISRMETQIQTIKSELESKNAYITELKEKLHLSEAHVYKKEQDYQEKYTELTTEISKLKIKLIASESSHIHINELERELKLLKEKVCGFEKKERDFDDIKNKLYAEISALKSELKSNAANIFIREELDQELSLLKVKLLASETREIVYKEQQDKLNARILALKEAYDYLKLTSLFASAFTLPSSAIKAVATLHEFIKKYPEHEASILLGKVFSEIGRLLKDFPSAGPEFAKTAIQMLYDLVENNEMSSLDALHLLLSISSSMSDYIDRSPISRYIFTLIFLVKCEGTSEDQQRKQKLIKEKLDERKKDSDLYKVLKQMLKQGYGKKLEIPAELREALIRFKLADLVPEDRELFKSIKSLEKKFQCDSTSRAFSEKFCITSDYLTKVEHLENLDNPKETQIKKVGIWSIGRTLIGKGGSVRVKDCATAGFWQKASEISDQQSTQTLTGSLRRKAYSNRRCALTDSTFTPPTGQEPGSSNSNGVRTLNK